jgi:cell division septal protein FtsQ
MPNRLEIAVRERKPTAWLASAPGDKPAEPTHLLDARGMVFQPKYILPEFKTLPTIAGVQTEDLEPGKPIRKAEVVAALELLKRTRETGAFKVVSIDVSKAYCLVATDHKRAQLTFGLDDIAEQLDRLSAVRGEATLIGQEIQTINLIPKRNIPVTFMQPVAPETDDGDAPPVARVIAKPKTDSPAKDKEKARPSKKDAPGKDGNGILKRFRTA